MAVRGGCENTRHPAHTKSPETCAPHSMMSQRASESGGSGARRGPKASKSVAADRNCGDQDQSAP